MPHVGIRSRLIGTASPQEAPPELLLEFPHDQITVRDLIAYTIEEQLYNLLDHQQLDVLRALRIVQGQYLTSDEMDARWSPSSQTQTGEYHQTLEINLDAEIEKAWDAFTDGLYLVIVDGLPFDALDDIITFEPNSRVTIMRPTSLI